MHPWSIHHQEFSKIFMVAYSSFDHYGAKLHQSCASICVWLRFFIFMCFSCHCIHHLWLHSKSIASSSTITNMRYTYLEFILVFASFPSRLIPKLGFDLGKPLSPTSFPFSVCARNRCGFVLERINIINKDKHIQFSMVENTKDHVELILYGPKKSSQMMS